MAKQPREPEDVDELISPTCSVEGCSRPGEQYCEMCRQIVCIPHARANHDAEMILCFSCDIGMREGLGLAKEGWD